MIVSLVFAHNVLSARDLGVLVPPDLVTMCVCVCLCVCVCVGVCAPLQGVLASGGEDKVVMLWRIDPSAAPNAPLATGPNADIASRATALRNRKGGQGDRPRPKELIMQHSGHRRGVRRHKQPLLALFQRVHDRASMIATILQARILTTVEAKGCVCLVSCFVGTSVYAESG